MSDSLPDIDVRYADGLLMTQGASRAAIEFLGASCPLINGTTALVAPEAAEEAFGLMDDAGLRTMTFGGGGLSEDAIAALIESGDPMAPMLDLTQ